MTNKTNESESLVRPLRAAESESLLAEARYQGQVYAFSIKGGCDVSYEECQPYFQGLRQVIQRRIVAKRSEPLAGADVGALYRVAEAAFVGRMTGLS